MLVGVVGDVVHRPRAAHMAPALAAVLEAPVRMEVRTEMQVGRGVEGRRGEVHAEKKTAARADGLELVRAKDATGCSVLRQVWHVAHGSTGGWGEGGWGEGGWGEGGLGEGGRGEGGTGEGGR